MAVWQFFVLVLSPVKQLQQDQERFPSRTIQFTIHWSPIPPHHITELRWAHDWGRRKALIFARLNLLHGYCVEHRPSAEWIVIRSKHVRTRPTLKIFQTMGNFQQRTDILI